MQEKQYEHTLDKQELFNMPISEQEEMYTGNIQLILGPMFAGKSSELLRRVSRYQIAKKKCIVIKYIKDTRYDAECVATHDRQLFPAIPTDELAKVTEIVKDCEVIGVDEGQFFPDLLPFCEAAANAGKIVIVSALDGDFLRKPFGSVCDLIPLAEHIVKLKAVCMICQRDAAFSKRITNDAQTELIGGSDKYIAVCRRCYKQTLTPQKQKKEQRFQIASPKAIRFVNSSIIA